MFPGSGLVGTHPSFFGNDAAQSPGKVTALPKGCATDKTVKEQIDEARNTQIHFMIPVSCFYRELSKPPFWEGFFILFYLSFLSSE